MNCKSCNLFESQGMLKYKQKFLVIAMSCMHSTGRLVCYEHRVVRPDTRSRVFAYYERITRCSYHAMLPGRMHTKHSYYKKLLFIL